MATPVGWGPFRELCFIRSHPKGGGHWVHLRRAEGAGLLGRQGLRAEGRSFRENSTFKPPATNAHSSCPGAYLLGQRPQSLGSRELQCRRNLSIHPSAPTAFALCSPAFLAAERAAADRFHPAGPLVQGHQSPHFPPAGRKGRGEGEIKSETHPSNFSFLTPLGTSWLLLMALPPN